ncbi:hypothetical protein SCHPADRAFT_1002337 [Schizopora paradoxa]|uniref:Uncharacterized protein n=1 Tax=Schizopora paradoxa TaxID=27342 RepID=A0A0H2R3X3_9AGAM|nr:hypothetical protein SCHPADRAFT_1002337 [Schizopora paradoxa]
MQNTPSASPDKQYRLLRPESAIVAFLKKHDTGAGVLLSHLDNVPLSVQRRSFIQTCVVHGIFFSIFTWRLIRVYENYGSLQKLYASLTFSGLLWLCFNLAILYVTGPPSIEFARTTFWHRLRYGFRPTEIVIRQPIASRMKRLGTMTIADAGSILNDQILRAMDHNFLQVTPGDISDNNFWNIDYRASREAFELSRADGPRRVDEHAWRSSVWLKSGTGDWKVAEHWKMCDPARRDRRQELLKDKLDAMGKGELYEKWRSMVQMNTTTPSGDSTYISARVVNEHLAFFEREGVDFGPIGEEINGQIDAEFDSQDALPIGF